MKTDEYGTELLTSTKYHKMFLALRNKIRRIVGPDVRVEHVGGTALNRPGGKGDIDIYVGYKNSTERNRIESKLEIIFGKPAKRTQIRTRFNDFFHGVEIELQLSNALAVETAVALRDYLNTHPQEGKKYIREVGHMRKSYLEKMYKLKSLYARKAVKETERSVG